MSLKLRPTGRQVTLTLFPGIPAEEVFEQVHNRFGWVDGVELHPLTGVMVVRVGELSYEIALPITWQAKDATLTVPIMYREEQGRHTLPQAALTV